MQQSGSVSSVSDGTEIAGRNIIAITPAKRPLLEQTTMAANPATSPA